MCAIGRGVGRIQEGAALISQKQLHVQLREALLKKISSGEWRAGQLIPNELDLAHAYQISPGTVRKAMQWMEQARLVVRKQGRGTFVLDREGPDLTERYVRVRNSEGELPKADIVVQHTSVEQAAPEELHELELKSGAMVRRISRMYSIEGAPFAWSKASMSAALFNLADVDVKKLITLPRIASNCCVILGEGEERVRPVAADKAVASVLRCREGTFVLASETLILTYDGVPAEWRRSFRVLPDGFYYSVPIGVTASGE